MKIFRPKAKVFSKKQHKSDDGKDRLCCVAVSSAGHDKGHRFIVVEDIGDGYVNVADGKFRTLGAPKKKNLRHLVFTGQKLPAKQVKKGKPELSDDVIARFLEEAKSSEEK